MCGICGIYNLDGSLADPAPVSVMRGFLKHRGPDDAGSWSEGPAALGFCRLSILDLEGGHQPMVSAGGDTVIVFNGEIYNHPELKSEFEAGGVSYRTRSDTETILHLYERCGVRAFERLNGIFALAVYDRKKRECILARDPMGVKPLYYRLQGGTLMFASELRALLAAGVPAELDPGALLEYLTHGFVHAPRTIVSGVHKLLPGHWLRVTERGVKIGRYWDLPQPSREAAGDQEAQERMESALFAAVRRQLLSDVPVGAFLSGGVDSSLVTALMAKAVGRPIPTFTIGFSGLRRGLDESGCARTVSRHIGTDHHELILPADVLDRVEDLKLSLDEPIADSAILPTALLARFARESVKVVLTGEGADELFAGYNRYKAAFLSEKLQRMPSWASRLAVPAARRMGKGTLFKRLPFSTLRDWGDANTQSDRNALSSACREDFLETAAMAFPITPLIAQDVPHSLQGALAYDMSTVLCDALLMKVDKSTMRASLEARVPFLDKDLVDLSFKLPTRTKLRYFKGKYLLRRIAAKYLPPGISWRRKHGFIVPWEEWLRRPSNQGIDDMLSGSRLVSVQAFDAEKLRAMRSRLLSPSSARDAGVDTGLFFRIVVLGLWLDSL